MVCFAVCLTGFSPKRDPLSTEKSLYTFTQSIDNRLPIFGLRPNEQPL
jgi:hypothetical protein